MKRGVPVLVLAGAVVVAAWLKFSTTPPPQLTVAYLGVTTNPLGQARLEFAISNACGQSVVRHPCRFEFAPESGLGSAGAGARPPVQSLKPGEVEHLSFPVPGFKRGWRVAFPFCRQGLQYRLTHFLAQRNALGIVPRPLRHPATWQVASEWITPPDLAPRKGEFSQPERVEIASGVSGAELHRHKRRLPLLPPSSRSTRRLPDAAVLFSGYTNDANGALQAMFTITNRCATHLTFLISAPQTQRDGVWSPASPLQDPFLLAPDKVRSVRVTQPGDCDAWMFTLGFERTPSLVDVLITRTLGRLPTRWRPSFVSQSSWRTSASGLWITNSVELPGAAASGRSVERTDAPRVGSGDP